MWRTTLTGVKINVNNILLFVCICCTRDWNNLNCTMIEHLNRKLNVNILRVIFCLKKSWQWFVLVFVWIILYFCTWHGTISDIASCVLIVSRLDTMENVTYTSGCVWQIVASHNPTFRREEFKNSKLLVVLLWFICSTKKTT